MVGIAGKLSGHNYAFDQAIAGLGPDSNQRRLELGRPDKEYLGKIGLIAAAEFPRAVRALKNSGWFNRQCEYLGSGDVSLEQPQAVSGNLEEGELVAMLPSDAMSVWSQKTFMDRLRRRTEFNPGKRYIADRFRLLIMHNGVYLPGQEDGWSMADLNLGELPTISRETVFRMLKPSRGHR